ncbi:clasp N terminal-domain-containing protein [Stachybotrys elegans]|uniref:Clasp N terminal-domain-containing protein n=1 Tax=Stachybotrys elegans TaxID=80388 RepID=A0A8K0T5C6_9HYPO|nr:clasp N terminal-domain-containing protein [Stachybotrys elegans]
MADSKLTDKQVADLATILRGDSSLDAKVQYVTTIKSGIKQHNVPEQSVPLLFDGLRAASTAQHAVLVNAGFTALNHLLTRMSRQEPKLLSKEAARTLPVVIEKLGDQKDKFRSLAMQSLNTFYVVAPLDVERFIRNSAMSGKNPRAKEGALQWLVDTHKEHGLQFRSYVPLLMELLEDADGMVRDAAKSAVIELFTNAPNAAKSDLKRQLKNFKVRPAIEQAIVKALAPTSGRPETPAEPLAAAAPTTRPALAASVSSHVSERPITPGVETQAEPIEPMYVNTNRELDDIFKDMAWHFEDKESEQNWVKREQGMTTLRRLNAGNAPSEFADTFISCLRSMLDGVIKAVTSLRTSLSKEGCVLVQEVANTFGPGMDPMVELLMQTFIKLSGGTKKISSQLANVTVDIILAKVTYTPRLMQHVWGACQDKNIQPRLYAAGWVKTLIKKESHHKSHIEHSGGVDLMEKCIRKGLADANPGVRERTRSTYWAFWAVWQSRADAIMADLDATAQKLLNKDPNNPNSPKKAEPAPRPGLGLSKSTMSAKPSLRETMMAQKKASMATRNLPQRPGSAMAHLSPVKTTTASSSSTSASASASTSTAPVKPATRTRQEPTISVNAKGMSVAPMRPARRRPEMAPRPATAGPYSVRDQPSSMEADSPEAIRPRAITPKPKDTTPRRAAQRPRPGHAPHASEPSVLSPTMKSSVKAVESPRLTPAKLKQSFTDGPLSSPSRKNEELTLVVPEVADLRASQQQPHARPQPEPASPAVEEVSKAPSTPAPVAHVQPAPAPAPVLSLEAETRASAEPLRVYEDPFVDAQTTPRPAVTAPVLEDRPVNEGAAVLHTSNGSVPAPEGDEAIEKSKNNSRLLESGISKIKAKSLEVHGFRKLQALIRDTRTVINDESFGALLIGLFEYLEDPLEGQAPEKAQDVKAQILATIKLLLKRERSSFQPHVSKCLESLLQTRSAYDGRAHIVSGLELLADELVTLGDGSEIVMVLTKRLQGYSDSTTEGCRMLSMGLHVLKEMLDKRADFVPTEMELGRLAGLAKDRLESTDSGVRMDAVQLCVALHSRVGDATFWESMAGVKDDPKSLLTYYIVKKQREQGVAA